MDVIELARELGKAVQQDERYKRYMEVCSLNDTDTELQNEIGKFNLLRSELSAEMRKPDNDGERLKQLDNDIRDLYDEIMKMPKMVEFNEAKGTLDELAASINYIVSQAFQGGDPETCPETPPKSCSGQCAGCGGCG